MCSKTGHFYLLLTDVQICGFRLNDRNICAHYAVIREAFLDSNSPIKPRVQCLVGNTKTAATDDILYAIFI